MQLFKLIDYLMLNLNSLGHSTLDHFWDDAAKALLSAIVFYLQRECNEDERNFSSVMKLLHCLTVCEDVEGYESTLVVLFQSLEELEPNHTAAQRKRTTPHQYLCGVVFWGIMREFHRKQYDPQTCILNTHFRTLHAFPPMDMLGAWASLGKNTANMPSVTVIVSTGPW